MKKPPKANRGHLYFLLATFCALPFILLMGMVIGKSILHIPTLSGGFFFALFLVPILLLVNFLGLLFLVLAWKKNGSYRRAFLAIYAFFFIIYWVMLLQIGPL